MAIEKKNCAYFSHKKLFMAVGKIKHGCMVEKNIHTINAALCKYKKPTSESEFQEINKLLMLLFAYIKTVKKLIGAKLLALHLKKIAVQI